MTRAGLAAAHLDFAAAWAWNPRVVVVLPLLAVLYLRFAWATLRRG